MQNIPIGWFNKLSLYDFTPRNYNKGWFGKPPFFNGHFFRCPVFMVMFVVYHIATSVITIEIIN